MDLTDAGPTADTTVHSSAAFSIGGYTNVLEAGQHPQWGAMVSNCRYAEHDPFPDLTLMLHSIMLGRQ